MTKVFISYRRQPSAMLANLIPCKLGDPGIDFFLDTVSLEAGTFPEQLVKNIKSCDVFVCLLAKTTLESKYVCEEISHAATAKKLMIPVFQEDFSRAAAPDDPAIQKLLKYNGPAILDIRNEYVDHSIHRLGQLIHEYKGKKPRQKPTQTTKIGQYPVKSITPPIAVPSDDDSPPRGLVQVVLEGKINTFDQQIFRQVTGAMLGVAADDIKILMVQPGSIQVTLEMPWQASLQLYYSALGQWPQLTTGIRGGGSQPCPRCRRFRSFAAGALAVLLVALAVWFYQSGIQIKLPNFAANAPIVSPTRTPRPSATMRPTRTPRPGVTITPTRRPQTNNNASGQGVVQPVTATFTPTETPTTTPTEPQAVQAQQQPVETGFDATYSPALAYDSGVNRYLIPASTYMSFYATKNQNICSVLWVIFQDGAEIARSSVYDAPFQYGFQFDKEGNYDVAPYPFTCDAGSPEYKAGIVFYFAVPPG